METFQLRPISYALLFYMGCYMILLHCQSDIVHKAGMSVIESQLAESWVWSMKGIALT